MQHVECALRIECTDFVILTEKPPRSSQDLGHARQAFMLTLKASSMEPGWDDWGQSSVFRNVQKLSGSSKFDQTNLVINHDQTSLGVWTIIPLDMPESAIMCPSDTTIMLFSNYPDFWGRLNDPRWGSNGGFQDWSHLCKIEIQKKQTWKHSCGGDSVRGRLC